MVDRQIVYTGALPESTDILDTNKFGMFGLGYAMHGVLGTSTVVEGLACTPTSPTPDLNVHVNVGSIYSMEPADQTAYGDLGIDNRSIVKQGINQVAVTLAITPPSTVGFSQVYLVQVAYNDVDAGSTVLSYFNASNPAAPYSGPANSGMSQFTTRTGVCAVALKAGVAATTGTQTTPAPDAGFTGLYAITVANGATQVTSGNIVQLPTAPFFPTLPAVPSDVQDSTWVYAVDTSTGGTPLATNATTAPSSAVLHFASVPSWVTVGMTAFDTTTPTAITGSQTVLSKTSNSVTLSGNVNATVSPSDVIAFSTGGIVASISPPPAALVPGLSARIKLSSTNTGATTLNLNGLGAVAVHRATGAALAGGDLASGMIAEFIYDGSAFQVLNFEGAAGGSVSNSTVGIPYCVDTGTINAIIAPFSPAITSLSAGTTIEVKIANTNSGATTIIVNALSSVPVVDRAGSTLLQGALNAGEVALMIYDGTSFQVVNNTIPQITTATTFYINNSTGSDTTGNGLSTGTAWASVGHALATLVNYNLNGNTVTLQLVTTGINYVMPTSFSAPSVGTLVIQGQVGNQAAVTITNAPASSVVGLGIGNLLLQYVTVFLTALGANTYPVFVENGPTCTIQFCTFLATGAAAEPIITNGVNSLVVLGPGNIYGMSAAAMWWSGGNIAMFGNATVINGPTWSVAGVIATLGGLVTIDGQVWTWSGSGANGPRYGASLNGIIESAGQGANYFPGSLPGVVATGGHYI